MTTIIDLNTKQSSITEDADGFKLDRYALVYGVTGDADQKLKNALADAGLPSIGDAHPEITSITLQSKRGTVIDASTVQVQLSYYFEAGTDTGESNADLSATTGTVSEERKTDIYSDPMGSSYSVGGITRREYYTSQVEIPRTTFNFEWQVTDYPRALIDYIAGKVNDDNWNGYAAETILCTSISASPNAADYTVRATFAYEPETWRFTARALIWNETLEDFPVSDPDTDLDHSVGTKQYQVYLPVDYSILSLTIAGPYCQASGTCFSTQVEDSDIVSGGKTIILTLTGDTWLTAGASFDAQRQNILDGLVSNRNEAAGWNAQNFAVTDVARTSSTVVTITLSAEASYSITKTEVITITVPASAVTTSGTPLAVSQRFTIRDQSLFQGDGS